jgi:hypothetical protein
VTNNCAREADVVDALMAGRWPETCDAELRSHVSTCAFCTDLVTVALPLLEDHHASVQSAQVPSGAIVWWRAQLRARREAADAANRPITVAQCVALVAGVAVLFVIAGAALPMFTGWLPDWNSTIEQLKAAKASLSVGSLTTRTGVMMMAVVAFWAIATPIALYFARTDD